MMLETLSFPLDTNDVVNSLETMERQIKEFETNASINIPEILRVGIVVAPKRSRKGKNSKVTSWFCAKKGHRASGCRKRRKNGGRGKSKGPKKGDGKGAGKGEKARKDSKGNASSAASRGTRVLEIGSRQASEKSRKIRIGIDSCAAVTVFPRTVAED